MIQWRIKVSAILSSNRSLVYKLPLVKVVQKAKFEYSPLDQVFNKGLDVTEKKEILLKRLKNIEGKNEQQLELIKTQGEKQLNLINKNNLEKESK